MQAEMTIAELLEQQAKMTPAEKVEQFNLFTNCRPLAVTVGKASQAWGKLGLTRADIQNAAESRLRAARIYGDEGDYSNPLLRIIAGIVGGAFSVELFLDKPLFDGKYSSLFGDATTYMDGHLGTHGGGFGGGSYILSTLSLMLDRFIANYLRVNEAACEKQAR